MSERPLYEQYRARIDALRNLPLNFDLERREQFTTANGWRVDDVQTELPPEPPGPPQPGGSWEIAKQVLQEYRFADPTIITGIFYPDQPIEGRVMLLRARAFGLTFYFGTRVGNVRDEQRVGERGPEQVWGFNYQTLEGHLERGQMEFSVIKWLESGQVAFRIHAFSQPGEIRNPIIRLGFRLFGRRVQLRFIRRSLERMRRLVAEELASGTRQLSDADAPPLRPASDDSAAARKVEELREQRSAGSASSAGLLERTTTRTPRLQKETQTMATLSRLRKHNPIRREDIPRWLTFTGFWGAIFYLLSCVSLVAGSERRTVQLHPKTLGLGLLLHVASFMAGGALAVATGSLVRGKSSTVQSEEQISSGQLERTVVQQGLGGAVGSVVPFGMAVGSIELAGRITGVPAFGQRNTVNWPIAVGTMVVSSGLVALAVSRITAWVARDARRGG
ncbi:MAG: hypothetical protein OHK0015_30080 [Chloroflexi bacterium OHK40]